MKVQHTAIQVADLEATRRFYEGALGMEYDWDFHTDDGVHNYYVTGDGGETSIQFVHDPDADAPEPAGIVHLAVLVDDADAAFERVVEAADPPVHGEPTTIEAADARAAFVEDPDGYEVEIYSHVD